MSKFCLRTECDGISSLQVISEKAGDDLEFRLLTSPKYHCKLAGEGVKYAWGRFYRNKTVKEKRTKEKFHKIVRVSMEFVKKHHVMNFAAKCWHYMMSYNTYDGDGGPLTYKMIKCLFKMVK